MRIVSLIPSGTEIVCALGYHEYLVGISHECDFPLKIHIFQYVLNQDLMLILPVWKLIKV